MKRVVETARGLEGLRRQDSIHAAAVVISPRPLTELVPIQQKGEDAEIVTQFEMHGIEDLGLLKMDFLGLRTLSTIERCLELVEATTGERPDIDHVDLEDQPTFDLLSRGDTIGVFQLEGTAMRALIRSLRPDRFEDVIALVALYRPGPMSNNWHNAYAERKNKRQEVDYPHPATESVLSDTFGLMIYQEQVMEIAREMAGYSMADADSLRKAMGKKIPAIMRTEREKFVNGVIEAGNGEQFGGELFDSIEGFAGYGFNKSHSAAYGLVAYQTAYLKAHFPAEYMAALLTSVKRDKDKTAVYLNECRTMGIDVLTPSVNVSESDFNVLDRKIMFGLSAVRNVGEGVVEKIVEERRANGPYVDYGDYVNRVDMGALNKRTVESLIKAGAFDLLGHARKRTCCSLLNRSLTPRSCDGGTKKLVSSVFSTGERLLSRSNQLRFPTKNGRRKRGWHSKRRCSACMCPITHCSVLGTSSTDRRAVDFRPMGPSRRSAGDDWWHRERH